MLSVSIESGAVMVGSATVENNAAFLKGGELVAVRGEGKFFTKAKKKPPGKAVYSSASFFIIDFFQLRGSRFDSLFCPSGFFLFFPG
jgi:hypothetical protein